MKLKFDGSIVQLFTERPKVVRDQQLNFYFDQEIIATTFHAVNATALTLSRFEQIAAKTGFHSLLDGTSYLVFGDSDQDHKEICKKIEHFDFQYVRFKDFFSESSYVDIANKETSLDNFAINSIQYINRDRFHRIISEKFPKQNVLFVTDDSNFGHLCYRMVEGLVDNYRMTLIDHRIIHR